MDADTKTKLKGAIKTGSDKYEGYSCDTYTTSDQKGAEQIKFWVSTDPSFPFTLKTVATDKTLNKVTTVDLENIGLNVKLDDSTFEVPKNIKMETTPAVKKGDGSGSPAPAAPAAQDSAGSGH
jgi:outer membrane lipoprotein-sorting protein